MNDARHRWPSPTAIYSSAQIEASFASANDLHRRQAIPKSGHLAGLTRARAQLASTTSERDRAGVRPSSGATRSACSGLPELSNGLPFSHVAAPEDGRTLVVPARCVTTARP